MSKAIYQPSGKAREYSRWACNLYVGCSNDCSYCFNKRGILGTVMGGTRAVLKSGFKDDAKHTAEENTFLIFTKELMRYRERIITNGGLLFSFATDPCLPETIELTMMCVGFATGAAVPCLLLTKRADWVLQASNEWDFLMQIRDKIAVGFSLTGCDDLEPGASTNAERIEAMRKLHEAGVKTYASIEPVIDFDKSFDMIRKTTNFCDHYKIGLLSGDKHAYDGYEMPYRLETFIYEVNELLSMKDKTVYWKDSVRTAIKHPITDPCCVGPDFSLFDQ